MKNQATKSPRQTIRPGTRPDIKSLVIESPVEVPMTIMGMLGGIIGATMAPAAIKATERLFL